MKNNLYLPPLKTKLETKLEIATAILNGFISNNYNTGIPQQALQKTYVRESVHLADMLYREMINFEEKK